MMRLARSVGHRLSVSGSPFTLAARSLSSVSHHQRDSRFSRLTSEDVAAFKEILGGDESALLTNPSDLQPKNRDWTKRYTGNSELALLPSTTEQVAKICGYCNTRKLAVVPQGGNTGLVGGGVPVFDEIVLSLQRMRSILEFDSISGIVRCQSGVVLQELNDFLEKSGHMVPLDLGAKGSCHIGGNISTNAGGLRLLRYGSLHGSVLGLEVVTAEGKVLSDLHSLRKDNTGYDLKQLFIGSEGTLGVITAASILAPVKPMATTLSLMSCKTFDDVLKAFSLAKRDLAENLSAFEYLDDLSLDFPLQYVHNTEFPLSERHPYYIVVEVTGSNESHVIEVFFFFFFFFG